MLHGLVDYKGIICRVKAVSRSVSNGSKEYLIVSEDKSICCVVRASKCKPVIDNGEGKFLIKSEGKG